MLSMFMVLLLPPNALLKLLTELGLALPVLVVLLTLLVLLVLFTPLVP